MPLPATPLRFELTSAPVSADEQRLLEPDLLAQRLDARYWAAMNGLLSTCSRSDTPVVLRAWRAGRLAGAAYLMECRRTSRCLFPGAIGRALDLLPMPAYYWTRGDAAVDLLGSSGFVAGGEDRRRFYHDAIAFLNSRYLSGIVMDQQDVPAAADCYETPMMDWGRYPVTSGGTDTLFARHRNLRRKLARYRNHGGVVDRVHGALAPEDLARVLHCIQQSADAAPLRAPFQENYLNMVRWASTTDTPGIVHFLARLDGTVVGYHSYLESGTQLLCLSGGFDRTRATNFHAYENILIETMHHAEASGISQVSFGPVGNPSKAALMPQSVPFVARFYSRHGWLRRAMRVIVPRSALRHARFTAAEHQPGADASIPVQLT